MRPLLFTISFIAVISIILNVKLIYDRLSSNRAVFKVQEVIDGDTFKIKDNSEDRRVKLIGVDTPEVGKCLVQEAKDKLTKLVFGKNVTLTDQFSDPYSRIMANVFVNNLYINKELLLLGLGRMDYYENPRREELKNAYAEARTKKLGLHSWICLSNIAPKSSSGALCSIKGNIDDNTRKKIYFLPGCRNYSQVTIDLSTDDQWFCTEVEAIKAGFTRSQTCD